MAKKEKLSPGGGVAWAEPLLPILFWGFWTPMLYIIIAPWLSLGVMKVWPTPVFAGFFNAMASTGWLCASVVVFLVTAYQLGTAAYQRRQRMKGYAATSAAKKSQSNVGL